MEKVRPTRQTLAGVNSLVRPDTRPRPSYFLPSYGMVSYCTNIGPAAANPAGTACTPPMRACTSSVATVARRRHDPTLHPRRTRRLRVQCSHVQLYEYVYA